jgi:hypothetical protein
MGGGEEERRRGGEEERERVRRFGGRWGSDRSAGGGWQLPAPAPVRFRVVPGVNNARADARWCCSSARMQATHQGARSPADRGSDRLQHRTVLCVCRKS